MASDFVAGCPLPLGAVNDLRWTTVHSLYAQPPMVIVDLFSFTLSTQLPAILGWATPSCMTAASPLWYFSPLYWYQKGLWDMEAF